MNREEAIEAIKCNWPDSRYTILREALDMAISALREQDAADVATVRHGRWIETPRLYYGAKQYECSLCYSDKFWNKHSIYEKYPHCPNCGARMDLK